MENLVKEYVVDVNRDKKDLEGALLDIFPEAYEYDDIHKFLSVIPKIINSIIWIDTFDNMINVPLVDCSVKAVKIDDDDYKIVTLITYSGTGFNPIDLLDSGRASDRLFTGKGRRVISEFVNKFGKESIYEGFLCSYDYNLLRIEMPINPSMLNKDVLENLQPHGTTKYASGKYKSFIMDLSSVNNIIDWFRNSLLFILDLQPGYLFSELDETQEKDAKFELLESLFTEIILNIVQHSFRRPDNRQLRIILSVYGIDITLKVRIKEDNKSKILAGELCETVEKLGDGNYAVCTFVKEEFDVEEFRSVETFLNDLSEEDLDE